MYITQGAPAMISGELFTREKWKALDPSSMLAFNWENKYLCFFGDGTAEKNAFVIDPANLEDGVRFYSDWATAGFYRAEEDILYVANGSTIYAWDDGASNKTAEYITRVVRVFRPINFSLIRVEADAYPVSVQLIGDDSYRYELNIATSDPTRLPGGYKATDWKLTIATKYKVSSIALGQSMAQFSQDPV
jgi:hypothetical protein